MAVLDVEQSLQIKLTASTQLTDIIGSNGVQPMLTAQDKAFPTVTYQLISNPPHHAMGVDAPVYSPRYQLSVWSTGYEQAKSISKLVKSTLKDFSGVMCTSGVTAQRIFFEHENAMVTVEDSREQITYHLIQDFIIWYTT